MCYKPKQFIPCRNCPRKDKEGPTDTLGYYYDTVDGYQVIKECQCHKKWRKEAELALTLYNSDIQSDYNFSDYKGTKSLLDLLCIRNIAENPDKFIYNKMIYLYGPNGTQKTTMCQCLGKELILKGYSVQYILMDKLIKSLVSDFNRSEEAQTEINFLIKRCLECDFLIIDEAFDLKKITIYNSGYQIPYLDNFLRTRFDINKKSIIFISNRAPHEIGEIPSQRLNEPIKEGFGISLQNFVERNVKQSTLEFKDVWLDNANNINRRGLFGL